MVGGIDYKHRCQNYRAHKDDAREEVRCVECGKSDRTYLVLNSYFEWIEKLEEKKWWTM